MPPALGATAATVASARATVAGATSGPGVSACAGSR
jgi:hypothetical protein